MPRMEQQQERIRFSLPATVALAVVAFIAGVVVGDTQSPAEDLKAELASICTTGSPARLDLSDMVGVCREALR
jgi:hypothetical protein